MDENDRKILKKERVARYFLDAAKEIILAEGFAALTTKKVGDKAAYSYASIYNYFENFNELACLALEELASACADRVRQLLPLDAGLDPVERIHRFGRIMIDHNAENPNVYSPFLSTEIDFRFFIARDGRPFVHPAYPLLLEELGRLPSAASLGEGGLRMTADILTYIFHSKLSFYIRYGTPTSLDELRAEVDAEMGFLLSRL